MNIHQSDFLDSDKFQNLVSDCFNVRDSVNTYIIYGRKGQKQHGIDIYSSETKTAIQCKFKEVDKNLQDRKLRRKLKNEIKSEVQKAIKSELEIKNFILVSNFHHDVDLIDYAANLQKTLQSNFTITYFGREELEKIIKSDQNIINKYFPKLVDSLDNRFPVQQMTSVLEKYRNFPSENWGLKIRNVDDRIGVELFAKHPQAQMKEPMEFNINITIPEKKEQKLFFKNYKNMHEKGIPMIIPGKNITKFDFPEKLKPYLGELSGDLIFQPLHSNIPPIMVYLVFYDLNGVEFKYNYKIPLNIKRSGLVEILLFNENKHQPIKIELLFNNKLRFAKLKMNIDPIGYNVKVALDAYKFMINLKNGGSFKIIHEETEFELIVKKLETIDIKQGEMWWISFLEKLYLLQKTLKVQIQVPLNYNEDDYNYLCLITEAIIKGYAKYKTTSFRASHYLKDAKKIIEYYKKDKTYSITYYQSGEITLFDESYNLGKTVIMIIPGIIDEECFENIKREKLEKNENKTIEIIIKTKDGSPIIIMFEKFKPKNIDFSDESLFDFYNNIRLNKESQVKDLISNGSELLKEDYKNDKELTSFTDLDADEFHEYEN